MYAGTVTGTNLSKDSISFGICNKEGEYFCGFDMHNDVEFGKKENAVIFSSRLLAEIQALLLANTCAEDVYRKAFVL